MSVAPRRSRSSFLTVLALAALAVATAPVLACASPASTEAVRIARPLPSQESLAYDLLDDKGQRIGSATVSIARDGANLLLSQDYTDLQQHTDEGSVTVDAATLKPLSAHRQLSTATLHSTLDVAYAGNKVTADVHDGQQHHGQATVTGSLYDDRESFFLLRALDFTPGYSVHFGIVVVDAGRGTISRALGTATVQGTTKITVKGRQLSAWQVQLTGAGATNTAWYDAGDPSRRLLRYTTGRQTTIELVNP